VLRWFVRLKGERGSGPGSHKKPRVRARLNGGIGAGDCAGPGGRPGWVRLAVLGVVSKGKKTPGVLVWGRR